MGTFIYYTRSKLQVIFNNQKHKNQNLLALISLLLLLLLAYNAASSFCLHLPFPSKTSLENANIEEPLELVKEEEKSPLKQMTHLPLSRDSTPFSNNNSTPRRRRRRHKPKFRVVLSEAKAVNRFSSRVKEFFSKNSCTLRFFMTWISSLDSFGEREIFAIKSLFNIHPNGCLVIVSSSMDSSGGSRILSPFWSKMFYVYAISPDFDYLFKHTAAELWFNRLKKGNVNPGEVALGQNLSNLLRLALLYKFGGVYIDSDVLILKSFSKLRNSIGAQTFNVETGNWTRLNNAVMIFDKGHPILYKFIEEFALTFDGNKWGHNGPYLVSRVVLRVSGRVGFEINILKPFAFYPVDWSRIRGFFRGPANETHLKWLNRKIELIQKESYAIHLWNRQSRKLKIENGSIISRLITHYCVFRNSSLSEL